MIRAPEWTDFDNWHTREYVESLVDEINNLSARVEGLEKREQKPYPEYYTRY